ncbi:MAG: FliM/FliN family flagellar motor switch protein, partial [Calditrichaeota bacterium]|nr:FliM/FliN family flagellar motor switch protein [Calditrichota bacterium]
MLALTTAKVSDKGSEIISERLQASKLSLQVILANTDVRIRDFIEFDTDDLLQIEKRIEEPLEIFVGKKLKFFGMPGRVGRHKAVKVIRSITQEEEIIYDQY